LAAPVIRAVFNCCLAKEYLSLGKMKNICTHIGRILRRKTAAIQVLYSCVYAR